MLLLFYVPEVWDFSVEGRLGGFGGSGTLSGVVETVGIHTYICGHYLLFVFLLGVFEDGVY